MLVKAQRAGHSGSHKQYSVLVQTSYRALATSIKILKNSDTVSFLDDILRSSSLTCAKFIDENVSYNIIYSKDWKQVKSSAFVDGLQHKDPPKP